MTRTKAIKQEPAPEERVGTFFLDSGAHSLYTKKAMRVDTEKDAEEFYNSREFWAYLDDYAEFIKQHKHAIDYYANVDIIFSPKHSWEAQQYLVEQHGLWPVPVVHHGAELIWIKKYLNAGHDLIGLGGLGQEAKKIQYFEWADRVYSFLCPGPKRLPIVRTHGFAMTSWELLTRYPWWSVDSASWVKAGGFGKIFVPHRRKGKADFSLRPYGINAGVLSPCGVAFRRERIHKVQPVSKAEAAAIMAWLEEIDVPLGSVDENDEMVEWGVCSHHAARKIANLRYFEALCAYLPAWPRPFRGIPRQGFFQEMPRTHVRSTRKKDGGGGAVLNTSSRQLLYLRKVDDFS